MWASVFPAFADDAPEAGQMANMPQRERDLLDILLDARKQYASSHSTTPAPDARVAMQIRVISFMRQSQLATDWIGTVKSRGITPEGNAWITIEIADGITISTWTTTRDDGDSATLFRLHAKLYAPAQAAKIASPVIFSGTILKSVLADDNEMVLRPRFIARFSSLKLAQ
ncbi:MAG: hypothetical protein JWM91_4973 [Rhodospirillales bacterium]|nr:hypothetical protein [Rhodospirillales bacterium]